MVCSITHYCTSRVFSLNCKLLSSSTLDYPFKPLSRPFSTAAHSFSPPKFETPFERFPKVSGFSYDTVEWTPRFDWRLRASSCKPVPRIPANDQPEQKRRRFIKRVPPSMIPVRMQEPLYENIQLYEKHFLPLLDAERAEEEAVIKQRLANWSLARLEQEGYCITGLSAFWLQFSHMGRHVAAFQFGPGIKLPPNNFERNGTQVLVTRFDPLKEAPMEGRVIGYTTTQLRVSFAEQFDLKDGPWRLDLGVSSIIYDRMCTAISHFNHDTAAIEQTANIPDQQIILQGTHLRDVLLKSFTSSFDSHSDPLQSPDEVNYVPHETLEHGGRLAGDTGGAFKDDMRIQSWARRYMKPNPVVVEGDPVLEGLNPTQIRAVATMIGERISLIQGPPGTGKTKTIIHTVHLLKVHFDVIHPILVCTFTNVAVDNLVEGFVSVGLKPLRIGYGSKASLSEHTLEFQMSTHPLKPQLDKVIAELEQVKQRIEDLEEERQEIRKDKKPTEMKRLAIMEPYLLRLRNQHLRLNIKEFAIHQEILEDVVKSADVICTTCISSATSALNVLDCPVVFLDEASMSTEPASLIPIMKGSQHLALIGDHKQLPPVITSSEAKANGLGISLFERLTEESLVPSIMLDIQYRMHPDICRFPSAEFYDFSLQNGPNSSLLLPPVSSHLEINPENGDRPSVIFLDHSGAESYKSRSRVNHEEAHIVCSVVEDLLLRNENLRGSDIGIIAPYVAQISLLTRLFNTDDTYRRRFEQVLGEYRAMQVGNIEIKTVDGFEGREKEIIIFSTVRSNDQGYIGFLADRRRLNVGLTRAKRGLFVVGNITTLKAGNVGRSVGSEVTGKSGKGAGAWRRYAEFLDSHGLIITLTGDKLQKALYGNYLEAAPRRD